MTDSSSTANKIRWALLIVLGGAILATLFYFAAHFLHKRAVAEALRTIPGQIVAQMTLEEKVGQLFHVNLTGRVVGKDIEEEIRSRHIGGVIYFGPNLGSAAEVRALSDSLQNLSRDAGLPPLLISTDQEGGRVIRVLEPVTQFPGAMAVGQSKHPVLAEYVGFMTAYELGQLGINFVLAPDLDVNNNPANPVINTRSFGSTAKNVAVMGSAYERGVRAAMSTGAIKHFPGHGNTDMDSHLALPRITRSLEELETVELVPFRRAIAQGADVVMTAHIVFSSIDPDKPATLSPIIIQDLLRKKIGFQGIVMSDAMEMHAVAKKHTKTDAARMAFQAGLDVILITGPTCRDMYDALLASFKSGELSVDELNARVERQVALKLRKGLYHRNKFPLIHAGDAQNPEMAKVVDMLSQYFDGKFADVDQRYADLSRPPEGGISVNTAVSRAGITSLRSAFPGVADKHMGTVRVYTRTDEARKEAESRGIDPSRIFTSPGPATVAKIIRTTPGPVIVELSDFELGAWNAAVASLSGGSPGLSVGGGPRMVGLYAGNPFQKIEITGDCQILASYSPTVESRRALMFRALSGPVPRADLVLFGDAPGSK